METPALGLYVVASLALIATPGQDMLYVITRSLAQGRFAGVCSAVGVLDEVKNGHPSHVTEDLEGDVELTDDEIRERMSGNLCRCGANPNILAAIREVAP